MFRTVGHCRKTITGAGDVSRLIDVAVLARDREEAFPAALKNALLARARQMHVRRGQIVIADETQSTDVYFIVSGRMQISLLTSHGRETILREMGPGRLFGELAAIDGHARSASVIAQEDSTLATLSAPDFRHFLSNVPHAGFWMAQQLAARVRDLTEKTFEMATMPVSNRLQNELLRLAVETGIKNDQSEISRLPTHADLASRIGTHREAVTRELGLLASEGITKQSGRKLLIKSINLLQAVSGRTAR
jgi:CRP/FNR family transcriptional regulator, cyclic AMP receptor protein